MSPLHVAILVNSALYITGVFTAGIWLDRPLAVFCAIATAAVCYIAPVVQAMLPKENALHFGLMAISIIVGAAGAVALIM
jgi:hypothetical protein